MDGFILLFLLNFDFEFFGCMVFDDFSVVLGDFEEVMLSMVLVYFVMGLCLVVMVFLIF